MKNIRRIRSIGAMDGTVALEEIVAEEAERMIAIGLVNSELDKSML
jgi:hypothetical protein